MRDRTALGSHKSLEYMVSVRRAEAQVRVWLWACTSALFVATRAGGQMEVLPRAVLRPSEVRMPRVPCRRSSVGLSRSKILAVVSVVSAMASLKSSITPFMTLQPGFD